MLSVEVRYCSSGIVSEHYCTSKRNYVVGIIVLQRGGLYGGQAEQETMIPRPVTGDCLPPTPGRQTPAPVTCRSVLFAFPKISFPPL